MRSIKLIKSRITFLVSSMLGKNNTQEEDIHPHEAYQMIVDNEGNDNFIVLDVRTKDEVLKSHIPRSLNLDYHQPNFKEELEKLDKNKTYLVYCRTGVRSKGAMKIMKELGFKKIYNLVGGITNWKRREMPLE